MWGATADWTVRGIDLRALALVRPAAVAVTGLAGVCWGVRPLLRALRSLQALQQGGDQARGEYRRREAALIRMADRIERPTVPLRRLKEN